MEPPVDPEGLVNLPNDMIEELLTLVPAENLLRLRTTCTTMNHLISDSSFIKKHLQESPKVNNLIMLHFDGSSKNLCLQTYSLSKILKSEQVNGRRLPYNDIEEFVGSCHGILCFTRLSDKNGISLMNPCLKRTKKLPLHVDPKAKAFDHVYGFGYDPLSHTHKVVSIARYPNNEVEVDIFTTGASSWRRIEECALLMPFSRDHGKFVNGWLHWFGFGIDDEEGAALGVVSLNLTSESFDVFMLPDYEGQLVRYNLRVFKDRLCVVYHSCSFIDVWVMWDDGKIESWAKLLRVPFSIDRHIVPYSIVQYISDDEQVLLWRITAEGWSQLFVYSSANCTLSGPMITCRSHRSSEICLDSMMSPCS